MTMCTGCSTTRKRVSFLAWLGCHCADLRGADTVLRCLSTATLQMLQDNALIRFRVSKRFKVCLSALFSGVGSAFVLAVTFRLRRLCLLQRLRCMGADRCPGLRRSGAGSGGAGPLARGAASAGGHARRARSVARQRGQRLWPLLDVSLSSM